MRLLIYLLLISLSTSLYAGEMESSSPLRWQKLAGLLQAMRFEEAGDLDQAALLWSKHAPEESTSKLHLFAIDLWQGKSVSSKSPIEYRFEAEYYFWQADDKSLQEFFNRPFPESIELRLLEVRFALMQRRYMEAKWLLEAIDPQTREQDEAGQILAVWLALLQGDDKRALKLWKRMEVQFLYQDPANLDLTQSKIQVRQLERALLLMPQDHYLYDRLVFAYLREGARENLSHLLIGTKKKIPDWLKQAAKAQDWKDVNPRSFNPADYERWARLLILKQDGESLWQLSQSYQARFPQLQDGAIYQKKALALQSHK